MYLAANYAQAAGVHSALSLATFCLGQHTFLITEGPARGLGPKAPERHGSCIIDVLAVK